MNFQTILNTLIYAVLGGLMTANTSFGEVIKGTGTPMKFELGYGIMVNDASSLKRSWVVINDESLPVRIARFYGLSTKYDTEDRRWLYEARYVLEVREPVAAIEIKIIPFNIWGEMDRPLSATEIEDFSVNSRSITSTWRSSESDAIQHHASIAYVSAVRLFNGRILRANSETVVQEAKQLSSQFSASDLKPNDVGD